MVGFLFVKIAQIPLMKKTILAAAAFTLAISCTKKDTVTENGLSKKETSAAQTKTAFPVDSVRVNDSSKVANHLTVAMNSKLLVFPAIKDKPLLDSIYSVESVSLNNYSSEKLLAELNSQKEEFFKQAKEENASLEINPPQKWYQNSDMKLFSLQDDFMTVRYTADGYSGGAHGYYNEIYKVFDLKNKKTLQLSDILITPDSPVWKRALRDNFLKNDTEKKQSEMLLVEEISPNSNFYFDKDFLYFLYNQYEITAYAAGPVLIKVPLSDVEPMLQPEFLKRIHRQ